MYNDTKGSPRMRYGADRGATDNHVVPLYLHAV
jgi:hypothetical protein